MAGDEKKTRPSWTGSFMKPPATRIGDKKPLTKPAKKTSESDKPKKAVTKQRRVHAAKIREKLPIAYPAEDRPSGLTAVAKVTASKRIGPTWYYLRRGKKITAPKHVITALRNAGFVE